MSITNHVRKKTVRLHYWIQNFSRFRLPRVLKEVEPTSARFDSKCFYNNPWNFFFNNYFNGRKHFLCFVSCIYHWMLSIKVCVYVVLLLFEEIQRSGFECYDSKPNASNEHYVKENNFMLQVNKKSFDESHGTITNI